MINASDHPLVRLSLVTEIVRAVESSGNFTKKIEKGKGMVTLVQLLLNFRFYCLKRESKKCYSLKQAMLGKLSEKWIETSLL